MPMHVLVGTPVHVCSSAGVIPWCRSADGHSPFGWSRCSLLFSAGLCRHCFYPSATLVTVCARRVVHESSRRLVVSTKRSLLAPLYSIPCRSEAQAALSERNATIESLETKAHKIDAALTVARAEMASLKQSSEDQASTLAQMETNLHAAQEDVAALTAQGAQKGAAAWWSLLDWAGNAIRFAGPTALLATACHKSVPVRFCHANSELYAWQSGSACLLDFNQLKIMPGSNRNLLWMWCFAYGILRLGDSHRTMHTLSQVPHLCVFDTEGQCCNDRCSRVHALPPRTSQMQCCAKWGHVRSRWTHNTSVPSRSARSTAPASRRPTTWVAVLSIRGVVRVGMHASTMYNL